MKQWSIEHGTYSPTAATAGVQYVNDATTPTKYEACVIDGVLFIRTSYNGKPHGDFRPVRAGETFYVELRERKGFEK